MSRSELDGAQRGRPAPRRQGGRADRRRWRRRLGRQPREVLHGRADQRGQRRAGRVRRRPAAVRRRRRAHGAPAALGALRLELGERFGLIPEGRHDVLWVVDFPMFEHDRRPALDGAPPPVHRADRHRLRPTRARCARAATTSSLDGVEIGGGSIRIHEHGGPGAGLRGPRHGRGGGAGAASASCSTRCATARRRTAASRWASTASSRSSPAATRSATSSRSRRPRRGGDPLTGAPAPVDERQLRELFVASTAPRWWRRSSRSAPRRGAVRRYLVVLCLASAADSRRASPTVWRTTAAST